MSFTREHAFVSREFMKEWGLRFLKSLNVDKEEYLEKFRVDYARLIQESLQDRRKISYSIDDVQTLFKNLQELVEREISTAMVNLSLKGLQHLRAILEHGEQALDFLPGVTVEDLDESRTVLPPRPKTTTSHDDLDVTTPSRLVTTSAPPAEWLQSVEEKMKQLDDRMSSAFAELERQITTLDQKPRAMNIDPQTLEQLLTEVQSLSRKLEQDQKQLANEIRTLKEATPRHDEEGQIQAAIELMNRQYDDIKHQLATLQDKIEEKLTFVHHSMSESAELAGIKAEEEQQLASSTHVESDHPMTTSSSSKSPKDAETKLDANAIKEFREMLENALVDIKSTLMDPLRTKHQLTRLEKQLEDTPTASSMDETAPEYEELRKTIDAFKKKLRERDLILEHTRKALSSNPKYAALWILQELGELPLSTLGKSVGVPPVVLKKELLDFEERGLIRYLGEGSDPIVQVVLDVPTSNRV